MHSDAAPRRDRPQNSTSYRNTQSQLPYFDQNHSSQAPSSPWKFLQSPHQPHINESLTRFIDSQSYGQADDAAGWGSIDIDGYTLPSGQSSLPQLWLKETNTTSAPSGLHHAVFDKSFAQAAGPPCAPSQLPQCSTLLSIAPEQPISGRASSYSPSMNLVPSIASSSASARSVSPPSTASAPIKSRRTARKPRQRIALAPDQPPTTQGRPRDRVYVACLQCRTKKIRCDGAKPNCCNCVKREDGKGCEYDAKPIRRGPDKNPGLRRRLPKELRDELESSGARRRRRRRTDGTPESETASAWTGEEGTTHPTTRANTVSLSPPRPDSLQLQDEIGLRLPDPVDFHSSEREMTSCHPTSYDRQYSSEFLPLLSLGGSDLLSSPPSMTKSSTKDLDAHGNEEANQGDPYRAPSAEFTRKVWWDSLLSLYITTSGGHMASASGLLTAPDREFAAHAITAELRFLFRTANHWLSFFHVPSFFARYCDPVRREQMQPSLILSALALSQLLRAPRTQSGHVSQAGERALRFRDQAQCAMEASFNAGWIDETLAQTAFLLAIFEVSAHMAHSRERAGSAMDLLDQVIRSLSLTRLDASDPSTSTFRGGWMHTVVDEPSTTSNYSLVEGQGCHCRAMSLGSQWAGAHEHTPLWVMTAAWDPSWSETEIMRESCRRVCWSAMGMAAGYLAYKDASGEKDHTDLFIANQANYALLLSGESTLRGGTTPLGRETIWALYDRAYLLWNSCLRMRNSIGTPESQKARFAVHAWLEADALEEAMNRHTCEIERAYIFQGREYLFNVRMCVSYEFQRSIPLVAADINGLFHRRKAEEWLRQQAEMAKRFMTGMHTITGNTSNLLARRPFFVFWFMGQVLRALRLWECDHSLTLALDVCKAFLPAIDYLTALWPCAEQRKRYDAIRERLDNACLAAGSPPPPPIDLSINNLI